MSGAGAGEPLAEFAAGRISAEVALMRLALAADSPETLAQIVADNCARRAAGLQRALHDAPNAWKIARDMQGALAAADGDWAAAFDRAVAHSPEASVALYSFGDARRLRRCTDEVANRIRAWGLVGADRRLLDIGCGFGRFEEALAQDFAAIVAVDASQGMIAEAQRRYGALANVAFRRVSGCDLRAVQDGCFDLALAVDCLPYVFDRGLNDVQVLLRAVRRKLAPGGRFLCLNFSYRGDFSQDRADAARLGADAGLRLERCGCGDFALWDGATFLFRAA